MGLANRLVPPGEAPATALALANNLARPERAVRQWASGAAAERIMIFREGASRQRRQIRTGCGILFPRHICPPVIRVPEDSR